MSKKSSKRSVSPQGAKSPSKLEMLVALLRQPQGASIVELANATGWHNHSVRGALSGTLKKKGHTIDSEVIEGLRRYRIVEPSA